LKGIQGGFGVLSVQRQLRTNRRYPKQLRLCVHWEAPSQVFGQRFGRFLIARQSKSKCGFDLDALTAWSELKSLYPRLPGFPNIAVSRLSHDSLP
jgi:hypothetical protein